MAMAAALITTVPPSVAFAQRPPSAADLAQARGLLNQGLKLRQSGDILGAIEKLKAANALANTPITSLELARTYAVQGMLVEARETCLAVGRIPKNPQETSRSAAARAEADQLVDQLADRIPSLRVSVTGVPKETISITIDDAAIPTEALDAPRLVDPGSHKVVARSTSGGMAEATVDVPEKETRNVELRIAPSAASPSAEASAPAAPRAANLAEPLPAEPSHSGSGHGQRVAGVVIGAIGVAGLGTGGVMGLIAKSQDDTAKNESFPAKHDDSLAASHLATVSTVVFCVGAAAAATGIILWLTAPSGHVTVGTNGQELLVRRAF
jgi:hypothetical protein